MQINGGGFHNLNLSKANFDAIYKYPDPREYFRVLCGLDYIIPDLAKNIFRSLISACVRERGSRVTVLDLGCSYGINAALIRYPLDLHRLAQRYTSPEMHVLPVPRLAELDWHYFRSWPEQVDASFVGVDTSEEAVTYAINAGLLDAAVTSNLEIGSLTDRESAALRDIDIIISTGCVGYVGERTFQRILQAQPSGKAPWVVSFVLRMFSYDTIASELRRFGLVTEKLEGVTFVQRRFHSEDEFKSTLAALKDREIDPRGKEADGLFHAELFVSRPKEVVERVPLNTVVSITSGANKRYGRRYRQISPQQVKLMH